MVTRTISGLVELEATSVSCQNCTITGLSTGVVHSNSTGGLSSSLIVAADITNGTITDSKLSTISTAGKVSNSATTATASNTASTIVLRNTDKSVAVGICSFQADNAVTMTDPQCLVKGSTDSNQQLGFGYNTTSNHGYIQSVQNLVAYTPLVLQPLGGQVSIGTSTTILPSDPTVLQVIESSPASNQYGGRIAVGGTGSGDLLFMTGLYNDAGTKRVIFGVHNNTLSAWADGYCQDAANLFINISSGGTVIGSNSSTGEKLKVVGTMKVTGVTTFDTDMTLSGKFYAQQFVANQTAARAVRTAHIDLSIWYDATAPTAIQYTRNLFRGFGTNPPLADSMTANRLILNYGVTFGHTPFIQVSSSSGANNKVFSVQVYSKTASSCYLSFWNADGTALNMNALTAIDGDYRIEVYAVGEIA